MGLTTCCYISCALALPSRRAAKAYLDVCSDSGQMLLWVRNETWQYSLVYSAKVTQCHTAQKCFFETQTQQVWSSEGKKVDICCIHSPSPPRASAASSNWMCKKTVWGKKNSRTWAETSRKLLRKILLSELQFASHLQKQMGRASQQRPASHSLRSASQLSLVRSSTTTSVKASKRPSWHRRRSGSHEWCDMMRYDAMLDINVDIWWYMLPKRITNQLNQVSNMWSTTAKVCFGNQGMESIVQKPNCVSETIHNRKAGRETMLMLPKCVFLKLWKQKLRDFRHQQKPFQAWKVQSRSLWKLYETLWNYRS